MSELGGRLIVVTPIWGRERFVRPSLTQSVELFGGEVYTTVQCMHPRLEEFEDYSEELARQTSEALEDVNYVETEIDDSLTWSANMAYTLNQLLSEARPREDDLVMLGDVDEFYTPSNVREIADYIEDNPEFVSLRFASRFVCPDMDHYVKHAHTRLHRFWKGRKFVPTSLFAPDEVTDVLLEDEPMFHYSLAVDPDYKEAFWDIEFGPGLDKQEKKKQWLNEVYRGYDPQNEDPHKERNEQLTGVHGFWFNDDCGEAPGGGLLELAAEHPPFIREYGLDELGDFREEFGEAVSQDESGEVSEGDRSDSLVLDFKSDSSSMRCVAGPWAGEFGYQLMMWVPRMRLLSRQFDRMDIVIPSGYEPLYEDVDARLITHDVDLGEQSWMANCGDARFSSGDWRQLVEDEEPLDELQQKLNELLADDSSFLLEPSHDVWEIPRLWKSYRRDVDVRPKRVLLHCRHAGKGRDWSSLKWDRLADHLLDSGFSVGAIGTKDDYLPPDVVDRRGLSLDDTMLVISSAALVVGGSSGVMHLASLCGAPHLVWGEAESPVHEEGTCLEEVYAKNWNPFGTVHEFVDTGWDPEVEEIWTRLSEMTD